MVEIIINKQIIQVLDLEETIIIKAVVIILVAQDLVVEQTLVVALIKLQVPAKELADLAMEQDLVKVRDKD